MSVPPIFLVNTRAGKGGEPAWTGFDDKEAKLFHEGFNYLVEEIRAKDREIAVAFESQRDMYMIAAQIFKAETDLRFGGIEPSTGQFGMMLIPPRPFLGANTWAQSISSAGWNNWFGSSSSPITGSTTVGQRRAYYYQGFIELEPGVEPVSIKFVIGPYTYPIMHIEEPAIFPKPFTTLKFINLDKNVWIGTSGTHYVRAVFLNTGTSNWKPLGLMFAEYDYLKTEGNFYT